MNNIFRAGAVLAVFLLVSCGGGDPGPVQGEAFAQPLRSADPTLCVKGTDTETVQYRLVNGECTKTFALAERAAATAAAAPLRAQGLTMEPMRAQPVFTFDSFVQWAEATYPQFFNGTRGSGVYEGYTYRFYAATGHYLAVRSDNTLYALGPATDDEILYVGTLSNLVCAVYPANCAAASTDFVPGDASTGIVFSFNVINPGTIDYERDQDWYQLTLTAGTPYTFTMEGVDSGKGTLSDPILKIISSSGQEVASNDDISYPSNRNARITYTPQVSGRYFLAAHAYSSSTGTFQLTGTQGSAGSAPDAGAGGGTGAGAHVLLGTWVGTGTQTAPPDSSLAEIISQLRRETWYFNDSGNVVYYRLNPDGTELAEAACFPQLGGCWIKVYPTSSPAASQYLLALRTDSWGALSFIPPQAELPVPMARSSSDPTVTPTGVRQFEPRATTWCPAAPPMPIIGCATNTSGVKPIVRTEQTESRHAYFYRFTVCFGLICRYVPNASATVLTAEGLQNRNMHMFSPTPLVWANYAPATSSLVSQGVLGIARAVNGLWSTSNTPTEAQLERALQATLATAGNVSDIGGRLLTKLAGLGYTPDAATGGGQDGTAPAPGGTGGTARPYGTIQIKTSGVDAPKKVTTTLLATDAYQRSICGKTFKYAAMADDGVRRFFCAPPPEYGPNVGSGTYIDGSERGDFVWGYAIADDGVKLKVKSYREWGEIYYPNAQDLAVQIYIRYTTGPKGQRNESYTEVAGPVPGSTYTYLSTYYYAP